MGGASASKYIFLSNILSKLILIISGVFLSRILPVEDFSYLLVLNMGFGFINLFSISGYEFYYIHNNKFGGADNLQLLRQVFNLRIIQSLLLFFVTNAVAIVAYFYGDPLLGKLFAISSFLFIIGLISKPEETKLSKDLNYKVISIAGFIRDLLASISKVVFALAGLGPLTFSLGNIVGNFFYSAIIKFKANLKLLRHTGNSTVVPYKDIQKFGFQLFLNGAGGFFTKQIDKLFVASFFEKTDQGLYEFSHKYASYAFNATISPQSGMVLSLMSKHRDSPEYLLKLFRHYGILVSVSLIPFTFFVFLVAEELIPMIFGVKWMGAVDLFRVFIVYYFLKVFFYPANGLLTSFGMPEVKARITIISALFLIPILGLLTWLEVSILYYSFAFILISSMTDFICMQKGFKLLSYSSLTFIMSRLAFLAPFFSVPFIVYYLRSYGYSELSIVFLSGLATLLCCTLIIYYRRFAIYEAMCLFIKKDSLLISARKMLMVK